MEKIPRIIIVLVLLSLSSSVHSNDIGDDTFCVNSVVEGSGSGMLHLFLIGEEDMGRKNSGIAVRTRKVVDPANTGWELSFTFTGLSPGEYGIRVYLDTNKNGELDRKGFRPAEPWGFSWVDGPVRGIPRFRDIAFTVPGAKVRIVLEEN